MMENITNVRQWITLLGRIFGDSSTVRIQFIRQDEAPQNSAIDGCWSVYLAGPGIGEAAIYREATTLAEAIQLAMQTYMDQQDRMLAAARRMLQEITLRN